MVKTKKPGICRASLLGAAGSIPGQRTTSLILDHAGFEEVFLFLQVHDLAHPGEGVGGVRVFLFQTDLGQAQQSCPDYLLSAGHVRFQRQSAVRFDHLFSLLDPLLRQYRAAARVHRRCPFSIMRKAPNWMMCLRRSVPGPFLAGSSSEIVASGRPHLHLSLGRDEK